MKISFDFDVDDWAGFQRYHHASSPIYRSTRLYSRITFPLIAVALILFHNSRVHGFDAGYFWVFAALAVLWAVFYPPLHDWLVVRHDVKFIQQGRKGMCDRRFGPREVELLPEAVHSTYKMGDGTILADSIMEVVETADALLLYLTPMQAIILPRRKIEPGVFAEAVAFAKAHYARG